MTVSPHTELSPEQQEVVERTVAKKLQKYARVAGVAFLLSVGANAWVWSHSDSNRVAAFDATAQSRVDGARTACQDDIKTYDRQVLGLNRAIQNIKDNPSDDPTTAVREQSIRVIRDALQRPNCAVRIRIAQQGGEAAKAALQK